MTIEPTANEAEDGGTPAEPLIAEAKLTPPQLRPGLLERPRIMQALDAGGDAPFTLVAAPPGYGKTTAIRAWCRRRGCALAWVTLDPRDNDPQRLWTYVATAIDRIRPGLGSGALQRLRIDGTSTEDQIDALVNDLGAYDGEIVIALDDVYTVTDHDCLESIGYALTRLPPRVRIVAMTRTSPELRLSRVRASGGLVELRARDLAFTRAETAELVDRSGLPGLDAEEVGMLWQRTEGWPAALALAVLWLRTVDDPRAAVHAFGAGHEFVAEYLSEEVFDSLEPDAREFLLRASLLGRFTAELCDGALERTDSATLLRGLESSSMLVTALERRGWFEVHALVAEFAALRLASVDPGAAGRIHRRAAEWCRSHRMVSEALEHAAAAGDDALVAAILSEQQLTMFRDGGARTLLSWVRSLPEDIVLEHPTIAVGAATSALVVGHGMLELRRYLHLVDRARTERDQDIGLYVRAQAEMVRAATVGSVREAVERGRLAVELAASGGDEALVAALGAYARALYLAGADDEAAAAATRAIEHPDIERRPPGHAFARSTLALVAAGRGQVELAREHAATAKRIVGRVGNSRTWLGANAAVAVGSVLMADGHIVAAERELSYAEGFFHDEVPTIHHAWLVALLACVRCRRGRLDRAQSGIAAARREMDALSDVGRLRAIVDDLEHDMGYARTRADRGELLTAPSDAEAAVLRLLVTDLSVREIAAKLYLSPNTVRTHIRAIYRKLGVSSRAEAVARATAHGLIDPPPAA
jgi:ATP/maltotriose-dependent transcriptional regulator MalT